MNTLMLVMFILLVPLVASLTFYTHPPSTSTSTSLQPQKSNGMIELNEKRVVRSPSPGHRGGNGNPSYNKGGSGGGGSFSQSSSSASANATSNGSFTNSQSSGNAGNWGK